jgi:hypothetical protein
MAKFAVLLGSAVAASDNYEQEWKEFQAVQGQRNGDIPEEFKEAVDYVVKSNAEQSDFTLSYTGPFAAMSKILTGKCLGTSRCMEMLQSLAATCILENLLWLQLIGPRRELSLLSRTRDNVVHAGLSLPRVEVKDSGKFPLELYNLCLNSNL